MIANIKDKVLSDQILLQSSINRWRDEGLKIVFTNGCFDIIHAGHVFYLESAKSLGDILIVGLNSDESVTRLKGPSRPINDQIQRSHVLAALASVDAVVVFDDDDPLVLIKDINPDILVKGGDWTPDKIIGSDHVLSNGGKVMSLQFIEGQSTTSIEQKIKNT